MKSDSDNPKNTRPKNTRRNKKLLGLGLLFSMAVLIAVGITQLGRWSPESAPVAQAELVAFANEPIQPIPLSIDLDERRVAIGDKLFHDARLSSNGSVSCATCHALNKGGTDQLAISQGMGGSPIGLNSPTVFNSGFLSRLNWDGSAKTLEEQANGPIAAVGEMGGMSWPAVVERLEEDDEYRTSFNQVYGDGVTPDNVRDAIATFQRSLYTPNAPFDKYLRGDEEAISAEAKQGYDLFKAYGCVACHQGVAVGGNMFQTLGIFGDYFADRGTPVIEADLGRFNVTQNELDRHVFRVPSLRNVVRTAPYFHDGNATSLQDAIKLMGKYQLGVDIPQNDVDLIMQFLRSLTGEYQGKSL
ncbi:MAG: cytochrome c peroxidase [Cyanobacteria bacterium P01_D01_bin.105]